MDPIQRVHVPALQQLCAALVLTLLCHHRGCVLVAAAATTTTTTTTATPTAGGTASPTALSPAPTTYYTAAVYEHAVFIPPERRQAVSRAEALSLMDRNLVVYEEQAVLAKQQGADILVFPEDGIYGMAFQTREAVAPYLEAIPEPITASPPCAKPTSSDDWEVHRRVSCMAKCNRLYIVANMGDRVACDKHNDPKCPADGQYQYNTDVVFGPDGNLIAKYHKRHLFYEKQFDVPESRAVYFDTPFGRFGLLVCFDLMFENPALTLVTRHNVTDMLFPTAWMDALPLLSAIGFHSSFSRGLGVNFLSSNLHFPSHRFHGSGIYSPEGMVDFYYNNSQSSPGKLLISKMDVIDKPSILSNAFEADVSDRNHVSFTSEIRKKDEFHSYVFHDLFTFRFLEGSQGEIKVCHGGICCFLNYEMEEKLNNGLSTTSTMSTKSADLFAFGAFDGLHTYEGQYYFQICSLVRCADSANETSCGQPTLTSFTKFKSLHMMGVFETEYIYPQVLLAGDGQLHLTVSDSWNFASRRPTVKLIKSPSGFEKPLLSATLFGRYYVRDPNVSTTTSAPITTSAPTSSYIESSEGPSTDATAKEIPLNDATTVLSNYTNSRTTVRHQTSTVETPTTTDSGHVTYANVCLLVAMLALCECFLKG